MKHLTLAALSALFLVGLLAAVTPGRDAGPASGGNAGSRWITHLSVDRPVVRPGETLRVRGVLLDAASREPAGPKDAVGAAWEVAGPRGETVARGWTTSEDGVLGAAWEVPAEAEGGRHTLRVRYPADGQPPAERGFEVRAFRAPTLKTRIVFLREGYGPGDEVRALLAVERAEGGPPATGTPVTAVARLDGAEVFRGEVRLDGEGNGSVAFPLPAEIARGEGSLSFVLGGGNPGGAVDTATRTLPILPRNLDVAFFPEGGVLAAGLPGRVYLEARTPWGDPADLAARLVDADSGGPVGVDGRPLPEGVDAEVRVRTVHEGRGVFGFTPEAGRRYALEVVEPAGLDLKIPLPDAEEAAATLRAVADRSDAGEAVGFELAVRDPAAALTAVLASREREVGRVVFPGGAGPERVDVRFKPPAGVDGVLRATVFAADGRPVAERLVFREPARKLRVEVEPGSESFTPGSGVTLSVRTVDDATGVPVAAGVGLAVTDDAELSVVDARDRHPRLPAMALLEAELVESGGLKDPDVYLGGGVEADAALDLLLGTRGWRRFAFVDPVAFMEAHGDAARRVLGNRVDPESLRSAGGSIFGDAEAVAGVVALERLEEPAPAAAGPPPARAVREADLRPEPQAPDDLALGDRGRRMDQAADAAVLPGDLVAVRVYAHAAERGVTTGPRTDFTPTVLWADRVQTDADGRATVRFDLSDRITGFRVRADAVDARGALGAADTLIVCVKPLSVGVALPPEVTEGDRVDLAVHASNRTASALAVGLDRPVVTGPGRLGEGEGGSVGVPAGGAATAWETLTIGGPGAVTVTAAASSAAGGDRVTRTLTSVPRGFPQAVSRGGMLAPDATATHAVEVPGDVVPGSLRATLEVYATPVGSLTSALEALIREPYGCFEQTSSTSYPLVMAQQYFLTHADTDPALVARSAASLDAANAKLTSFETSENGYEWFGAAPGHAALTAYGLMQFVDMAAVRAVDPAMLARTRAWLLARRDGEGGFRPDGKALDSFGRAPADTTDAYVTWALVQAGQTGLDPELARLREFTTTSDDPYVLALAAGTLGGDAAAAARRELAGKQAADGGVDGAATSITSSGGTSLRVETTALAVLAWLEDPAFAGEVERGVRFLMEACEGGRFGSTQATVLTLRAIVAYDAARSKPVAAGTLTLLVDGEPVGEPLAFDASSGGTLSLPDASDRFTAGTHRVELRMDGGAEMPHALSIHFHRERPPTAEGAPLALSVTLSAGTIAVGEPLEAQVRWENVSGAGVSMPIAIVGLPGGLEADADALQELVDAGRLAAYGLRGREVVLYRRGLAASEALELPIRLVAAVAGSYTGPASRAYPYYTDELKAWAEPLRVEVHGAE